MPLVKRQKNAWGKRRPFGEPYCTVQSEGWTWKILKAYQARVHEKKNEYARVLCAVYSPLSIGTWDIGDVYLKDIPMSPSLQAALIERERQEEETE